MLNIATDPDSTTPYYAVLDDWSAGIKGASQTIYADNRQPDIQWDDAMLAAQTGPIPYFQSSQAFIHGTGGYKMELGLHLFRLPAKCNDEVNLPVWETLWAMTPSKDRWPGYPSMVGYDPAYDSTFLRACRITVYNKDGSIHHIFQMQRDGIPLNDPSMAQTRDLTKRWRPFINTAQMLYHCSHRLKMSSDARKYYAGTVAKHWYRRGLSVNRGNNNAAIPVFPSAGQQVNGYLHPLMMPEWSANTSDEDFVSDPKTDPNIAWNAGNDPFGNAEGGAKYPHSATGWRYEYGGYNAGQEPSRPNGGQRLDRYPVPSHLSYLMTDPTGVRLQGNVPWIDLWHAFMAGSFNLSYHHVRNAKTMEMLPFSEVSAGDWGHYHGYYNPTDTPPADPSKWIDMHGWSTNQSWRESDFDRDGLHQYNGYTTDNQHPYDTPAWETTHFNSVAHAIGHRLRYHAMVMSWNKYGSGPTNDISSQVFQRQQCWQWLQMAFLWKTAGNAPLVPRADVEALWKLFLEAFHDNVVVPTTNPANPSYNQPLFAGLRNLGTAVEEVVSGGNHYYVLINDDKRFYFTGMLTIMRTLGCFDALRQLSTKCAAALDFVVTCYQKAASERMVATRGAKDYYEITPSVPVGTALSMPANWAAVAAVMQPQDNADMVRNADGTAYFGPAPDFYRDRWLYQHIMQQACYALNDHFSDYSHSAVAPAAAMCDDFEEFVYSDIQTNQREYVARAIAAGPMLTEATDVDAPDNPELPPLDFIGGALASVPFGAGFIAVLSELPEESTVTGVVVSPAVVASTGGATRTFTRTVSGTYSPSQDVDWTASAGSISENGAGNGVLVEPSAISTVQVITVTARSVQNNSFAGTAIVTIAALPPVEPPIPGVEGSVATSSMKSKNMHVLRLAAFN